jgi:predicted transcriptional regulator
MTKLEKFIKARRLRPVDLARESGYSRQHLLRVRTGEDDPTRKCMSAITLACRRLAHERVTARMLFDLP